jgi:hypothetical protein
LLVPTATFALGVHFSGQGSGWLSGRYDSAFSGRAGLRCIPTLEVEWQRFDAEATMNAFVAAEGQSRESVDTDARLQLYRLWARLSTDRFEARAGLQKVNFGSATLLRPLQWFDRIDPRDQLGLTDGVYGLLGRYYFQNNANLWAWGLIGNSEPKGWEYIGSERWKPEFGGRVQLPVLHGELAATLHHRRAVQETPGITSQLDDDRLGLDGKWDVGVGCWFEAALMRRGFGRSWENDDWQRMATVGLDYTFGVGNGFSLITEHMLAGKAWEPFGRGYADDAQVSTLMVSYPLGILDNVRGIVMFDWSNKDLHSYVGWQRTLDNWLFSIAAFWNPDTPASFGAPGAGAAGKGVQVMVVYNH